jgi:hypothetical protein
LIWEWFGAFFILRVFLAGGWHWPSGGANGTGFVGVDAVLSVHSWNRPVWKE